MRFFLSVVFFSLIGFSLAHAQFEDGDVKATIGNPWALDKSAVLSKERERNRKGKKLTRRAVGAPSSIGAGRYRGGKSLTKSKKDPRRQIHPTQLMSKERRKHRTTAHQQHKRRLGRKLSKKNTRRDGRVLSVFRGRRSSLSLREHRKHKSKQKYKDKKQFKSKRRRTVRRREAGGRSGFTSRSGVTPASPKRRLKAERLLRRPGFKTVKEENKRPRERPFYMRWTHHVFPSAAAKHGTRIPKGHRKNKKKPSYSRKERNIWYY